jgi:hypothetical protein
MCVSLVKIENERHTRKKKEEEEKKNSESQSIVEIANYIAAAPIKLK